LVEQARNRIGQAGTQRYQLGFLRGAQGTKTDHFSLQSTLALAGAALVRVLAAVLAVAFALLIDGKRTLVTQVQQRRGVER
jgi:hypothetical protein